MPLHTLIKPLGILTYMSLIATIATGVLIFKFHVKWIKMKWHIRFAILTLILATIHAGIVIYLEM